MEVLHSKFKDEKLIVLSFNPNKNKLFIYFVLQK